MPEGFVPYSEATTSILFAAPPESSSATTAPVFLNPVQQYNRDLSVVAIRTWSEARQREKRAYWEEGLRRKRERKRAREDKGGDAKKRKGAEGEAVKTEAEKAAEVTTEDKVCFLLLHSRNSLFTAMHVRRRQKVPSLKQQQQQSPRMHQRRRFPSTSSAFSRRSLRPVSARSATQRSCRYFGALCNHNVAARACD